MTEFTSPHDEFELAEDTDKVILENEADEPKITLPDVELTSEDIELVDEAKGEEETKPPAPVKKPQKTPRAEHRIGLLTRKNKELEEERNRLIVEREQMFKYLAEKEKKTAEDTSKMIDVTLGALKTEMEQAYETGDTKKFFDAQERYLSAREAAIVSKIPTPVPHTPTPPPQSKTSEVEVNWMNKSGFAHWPQEARDDALRVYTHLKDSLALDPDEPDFWDNLDRRLKKVAHFDKLYAVFGEEEEEVDENNNTLKSKAGNGKLALNRVQSPGRVSAIAGSSEGKKGIVLTPEDKQTMQMFNFNPNNPDDVKAFLKYRG